MTCCLITWRKNSSVLIPLKWVQHWKVSTSYKACDVTFDSTFITFRINKPWWRVSVAFWLPRHYQLGKQDSLIGAVIATIFYLYIMNCLVYRLHPQLRTVVCKQTLSFNYRSVVGAQLFIGCKLYKPIFISYAHESRTNPCFAWD